MQKPTKSEILRPQKGIVYSIERLPKMSDRRNNTIKIKNNILAIPAALAAIPPKPNIAATTATIKNITVQRNIVLCFMVKNYTC